MSVPDSPLKEQFRPCSEDDHKKCRDWIDTVVRKAPFVQFMMEKLKQAGCNVDPTKHIVCENGPVNAVFDAEHNQIVVCMNNIYSQSNLANVLTHEMIHAFDHCTGKVNFKDVRHIACMEVRAANLSGDCFMHREFFDRANFGLRAHQQTCVKRRAMLSVMSVTGFSKEAAAKAVDDVFETCYNDTTPFDRIP
eukprot:m.32813 g.32813  ORF g.32813 m.32813 type:complete len:193 (+) comp10943_c0_seq1:71-649(+)